MVVENKMKEAVLTTNALVMHTYLILKNLSFGNQRLLDLDISNALKVIIDFAHNAFPVQI